MRVWSRELRELVVRVLAGLGLVLALAVMGAVLVSTAVTGDVNDGSVALSADAGFGDNGSSASAEAALDRSGTAPSQGGVLLGAVLVTGGVGVLAWGARRPKAAPARVLQPISD